ncbi:S-layer-like y domain-containing protein [Cohnella lubricantis]|uniref:S-layer homology domain-containing protein n=1 Tax=Cohnella lubricantis TaxID=2163172 RepID=A0A841TLC5_9BACL|nr:S-layer homology domain-containing protein [Cohnella lubricantis]MBB6679727.1 S-layer homology domain-containing protein [Cohnella lubricantis]MBP2119639.1 hypothetical protein [Cohnella lubricantis]
MKPNLAFKVLTTAAMFSSLALPAYAAPASFSDINGSYAKDAIMQLVEQGIVNGVGSDKFNPTGNISRQDFAIILAKSLQLDFSNPPATATFTDVPKTNYAYAYVEAAASAGLVKGLGNGSFGASSNLSRQDMAVLFVRALGVDATGKGSQLQFSDKDSIADYAKDAVAAAVELRLIQGNPDGTFGPKGSADRQAVASVASRFLQAKEQIQNNTDANNPPSEEAPSPPEPSQPSSGTGSGTHTPPSPPTPPSSSELQAPTTIGFAGMDKLSLSYGSVLSAVYSADDFHVSIGEGDDAAPIEPKSIEVAGSAIKITLPEPIWNGKTYTVEYRNVSDKPVRSETGALSPDFSVSAIASPDGDIAQWLTALVARVDSDIESAHIAPDSRDALTGEYPWAAYLDLTDAREMASFILDEAQPDPLSLQDAYDTLRAQLSSFHATQAEPLTVSLVPDATVMVTMLPMSDSSATVTIGTVNNTPSKRNINSLIQVRRGSESAGSIAYSYGKGFTVGNTEGEVVGYISANDHFDVEPDTNGFVVTPKAETIDGNYSIPFDLTERGEQVTSGHVELPVALDRVPTSVINAVYGNGVLQLSTNEPISTSVTPSVRLRYSPSNDFSDTSADAVDLTPDVDYTIEMAESQIRLVLQSPGLAKLEYSLSGQFLVTLTGIVDQYGIRSDLEIIPGMISSPTDDVPN